MRIIYPALALISLLCGCSTVRSDSKIEQRLVGAWTMQQAVTPMVVIYYPDGTWETKFTPPTPLEPVRIYSIILDGTWKVKDGVIIKTTSERTQARFRDSIFGVEHLKVIRINDDSLTLCQSGETNSFTLKKL